MNTTDVGRAAEQKAAEYLSQAGHEVIETNWRTRWCEIDLITRANNVVHIVEVKYRRSACSGDGFAAITPLKRSRLVRAAQAWTQYYGYSGSYQIDVIALRGDVSDPEITIAENISADW